MTSVLEPIFVLRPVRKANCFQHPHNKQTFESAGLQFILDSSSVGGMCYIHWDGKWTVCITRCNKVQMGSSTKPRGNEHIIEHRQLIQPKYLRNKDQPDALFSLNTFTAIVDLSQFNNSCLKSPASTLVDLTFQSRALRSFSLNQLRNLSL